MKTLVLSLLAVVCTCAWSAPDGLSGAGPVNVEQDLQVVVHDNLAPRQRDWWTQPRMDRERYLEFEIAIRDALKAAGYAGPVKVVEFAANIPQAEQRLDVYIYRWETGLESFGSSFTAEISLEAVLRVGDREFDLGAFTARESHVAIGGPKPEDYRPVARRAVDQMIEFYRSALAAGRP